MKTFWDLPEPVRQKIYRLSLVADEQPVHFFAYLTSCGYTEARDYQRDSGSWAGAARDRQFSVDQIRMPQLLQVSSRMEQEASPIYFGENTFALRSPEALRVWKLSTSPRHVKQIRKVTLLSWTQIEGVSGEAAFKRLNTLTQLECLTLVVDEVKEMRNLLTGYHYYREHNRNISWHASLGFGPQTNLQLLRLKGMTGLRSLRGLRDVRFVKRADHDNADPDNVGSMRGGFLETVVKKEIMQPRPLRSKILQPPGSFRFMDLPPEIRNIVYSMHLVHPGPMYPVKGKPVSVTSRTKYVRRDKRDTVPAPCSALDILRVNRQVHDEAHKLFYQNDFVFSKPVEVQNFMSSLGDERLDCLRSLTIFYDHSIAHYSTEGVKLHLLLQFGGIHMRGTRFGNMVDASALEDARILFKMRGVADIMIRDLDLIDAEEKCQSIVTGNLIKNSSWDQLQKGVARQTAALRHFNHGLRLAQTGVVVQELCTVKDWRENDSWPALQGSDCGFHKGCSCGIEDVEAETNESETSG